MGKIAAIAQIAADRQKAKEIAYRVQNECAKGDSRTFAEVLAEEIAKEIAKEKATKDTGK